MPSGLCHQCGPKGSKLKSPKDIKQVKMHVEIQAQNMLGRIDAYLETEPPARPSYRSIRSLLDMLADVGEGTLSCFCRLTLDPDGPCRCATGDCDGCSECPTGKARSILVALGLA